MRVSTGADVHLHRLLSNPPWSQDVAEAVVVVATVILEDVVHLEEVVVPMVVNKLLLIRSPSNVNITGGITKSLRSAGRNLVALNGHSWLILILLPLVILSMFIL